MPDSMTVDWNTEEVAQIIEQHVRQYQWSSHRDSPWIVTFDVGGVSGHPNHQAAARGATMMRMRWEDEDRPAPPLWLLRSEPLYRKYLSALDVLLSFFLDGALCRRTFQSSPWEVHRCMTAHASQYVWYRRLFVWFSSYTFLNTLDPGPPTRKSILQMRMDEAPPTAFHELSGLPPLANLSDPSRMRANLVASSLSEGEALRLLHRRPTGGEDGEEVDE